jgi:hypothetical protein
MNPLVTVITPTKNRLKLLCEAMDSVQRQSFDAWEHLVVDDGSDDGTAQEVARRAAADPRVRFIRRTGNKCGANVCRNLGVSESQADFIVFLDSDDLLRPQCLERRVALLQRNPDLDFATFRTAVFESKPSDLDKELDPQPTGDDLMGFLFFELPWIITGPIWRKVSLLKLGLFDESLLSWQDIDLHLRAIAAGLRYLRFPEVDHDVRWQFEPTKISIEQRRSALHLEAARQILEKFEKIIREGPGLNWVRQRALCGLYFFVAEQWVSIGRLSDAMRCWAYVRTKALGSRALHFSGATLLVLQSIGIPGHRRITNKWKGWMRLRSNPELV